jgi:uncharacterized protein YabE (DUF348 family)
MKLDKLQEIEKRNNDNDVSKFKSYSIWICVSIFVICLIITFFYQINTNQKVQSVFADKVRSLKTLKATVQ